MLQRQLTYVKIHPVTDPRSNAHKILVGVKDTWQSFPYLKQSGTPTLCDLGAEFYNIPSLHGRAREAER